MEINLEVVRDFIESNQGNEDVKEFLSGLNKVELAEVKNYIESTADGQKFLQSEKDRHFTAGLDTWKENNLPSLLKAERDRLEAELNPAETPDQKRLKELEKKHAERDLRDAEKEQELIRERLTSKAKDILAEKKLPTSLVGFFVGNDEESTLANIDAFADAFNAAVVSEVDTRLRDNGRDVIPSTPSQKIAFSKLPAEERLAAIRRKSIVYKPKG